MRGLTSFSSPGWLWLLPAVAVLAAGYVLVVRRRQSRAMRFANLELLGRLLPSDPPWRRTARHAPVALLLVTLVVLVVVLVVALAGPVASAQVPRDRAVVLVIVDVSLSMQSTDVAPTRIAVAEDSAQRFADQLPPGINLGLMSFAGTTDTLVTPTRDRDAFKRAVGGLQLAPSTATGDAIRAGLELIRSFGQQVPGPDGPPPARIILLSDGKQTVPTTDPADPPRGAFPAADQARAAGVPISTVSFGTEYGTVDIDGRAVDVPVADADMHEIADRSGGQFFRAASDLDLRSVYDTLATQIGQETVTVDDTHPWVLAATALLACAVTSAFALGQRLP